MLIVKIALVPCHNMLWCLFEISSSLSKKSGWPDLLFVLLDGDCGKSSVLLTRPWTHRVHVGNHIDLETLSDVRRNRRPVPGSSIEL